MRVDIEKEVLEGLEHVGEIEREILANGLHVEEYIMSLETEIDSLAGSWAVGSSNRENRVILVAKLCALSELCSVIDFDKMIEVREKFIDLFPDHFQAYLGYLETSAVSSNLLFGCIGCVSYQGTCALKLEPPSEHHGERCPSRVPHITW